MDYMDFRRKIITDRIFSSKFVNCRTPQALIKAAALEGFVFTEEDIRNNTDLLPEELAAMAGGTQNVDAMAIYQMLLPATDLVDDSTPGIFGS